MPPIPPTKKKPISDFASALQQAASGSVADVTESTAPVSQPKGKSDFAMALEEAAKKKVGTTDGGNTATTSAQLPSGSEAQSPSTTTETNGQTLGNSYNIATLNGAIQPEGTFNNKPVEDNSMRSILSGTNTGIANDKPTPSQAVKVGETVLPDIKEAIDSTAIKNIQRRRGVYDKTLPPPTKDEIKSETDRVTQAYKNGDIIPSLDGGKSVMKRGIGVAETFFKALNDAKRTKAEDAYFESLSNDERARYLNLKQEFPQSFETSDNSTTPGSKVMGINLGQVGKGINSISEFGGENAGMLSTVTTGAMALTAAAPAIAASTALVGTAGAGEFGGFLALSNDMAGFKNNYEKAYYSLKKQGLSDAEAADKAETAGRVGYATSLGVNAALSSNVGNAVSSASTEAVEGLINGLVKSTEHLVKREIPKMAITSGVASLADSAGQSAVGVDVSWGDAFKEAANAAGSGAVTALSFWGLHQAAKIATSIPSYIRPLLENVAATTPVEAREAYLNKAVEQGIMTEPEKVKVSKSINEFGETKPAVQDLPIPEEKKAAITGKLIQAKKIQEEIDSLTPYGASFNDRISQLNAAKENIHADIQKMYAADDVFSVEHDSVTGEKPVTAPAVVMPDEINRPTKEVTIAPDESLKPETKQGGASVVLPESNKEPNIVSLNGENKAAEAPTPSTESQAVTGIERPSSQETPAEIPTDNKAPIDESRLKEGWVRSMMENNNIDRQEALDRIEKHNPEFVTLYRGEGDVVSLENSSLPSHVKNTKGRWFTKDKKVAEDYAKTHNGKLYAVQVPKTFFETLSKDLKLDVTNGGEVLLPRIVADNKVDLTKNINAADESQNKSTEVVLPKTDAATTSSNESVPSKKESSTAANASENKQGAKQEIVTPEGFQNRIHDGGLALGEPDANSHVTEKGYTYRSMGQGEIGAISDSGGVFAREGKQKGGNKNVKYWSRGDDKFFYRPKDGIDVVRVKNGNINENKVVAAKDLEIWDKEQNKFVPFQEKQTSATSNTNNENTNTTAATPIEDKQGAKQESIKDFTPVETINEGYRKIKEKLGERKAKKYFEQANRLVNPNQNEIVDYRENGVVVKKGDKYILKPFADMDLKNWRIASFPEKNMDVTDQFASNENKKTVSDLELNKMMLITAKKDKADSKKYLDDNKGNLLANKVEYHTKAVAEANRRIRKYTDKINELENAKSTDKEAPELKVVNDFGNKGVFVEYKDGTTELISRDKYNKLIASGGETGTSEPATNEPEHNPVTSNTNKDAIQEQKPTESVLRDQRVRGEGQLQGVEQNNKSEVTPEEGKPKAKVSRTKASGSLRKLSENIRKDGILPNWAKADLPEGTQSQGFGGKSLDEAVAKALDLVADAIDAGKGLSDSVNEGFAHIRDYYQNNTKSFDEKKLKEQFKDNIKKQLRASGELSGITHAETKNTREEFGLGDPYEKTTKSDEQLRADAVNEIKKGYNIDKLVSDIEKGKVPSDKETTILKIHKANLEAAIEKNPSDENLAQLRRLVKASDAAGSEQGRALRSRQGLEIRDDSLAGYFVREQDIHGDAPIPEASKKQVIKEHTEITEAQKKLDEKIAALEKENARLKAEKKVKEQAAKVSDKTKKTKEDFVNERKDIIQNIRDKWKSAAKDNMLTAVPIPYSKQLVAIAPDVAKLVRSLVEEGVTKLADVTKNIHNTLKEDFPEITEKDVHNIIAGEYNEKKPTKTEIQQQIADLRMHSKLINRLEELQRGEKPKTEKERAAKNKEIEDLRRQIREKSLGQSAVEKRQNKIKGLKEELERVKSRKDKEVSDKRQAKEKRLSDEEKALTDQIKAEKEKWDSEKKNASTSASEYKKMESERNRQLKRVEDLKAKLSSLQSGILPTGEKRAAKLDTPEIEAIKREIETTEKSVRENIAQEKRIKVLETELERVKDQKAKETKPESKKEISEKEQKLVDEIDEARKKWRNDDRRRDNLKKLESELERVKSRKEKVKQDKVTSIEREVSDEEKALSAQIEAEQGRWAAEVDSQRKAAGEYKKMETERNRQMKRISDLKEKLATLQSGKLPIRNKSGAKADVPEIEALKKEIDVAEKAVRENLAQEKRMTSLEDELQRLKDRKSKETKPENKRAIGEEEQKLRDQIEAERQKWNDETKRTPEEVSLGAIKSRTRSEIEKLKQQLESGNFEKEVNAPVKLDQEAIDLKDKLIKLRKERESRIIHEEYKNRTKWEKAKSAFSEIIGVPRTLMSSLDFSAPLRQALIATVAHPKLAASAGLEMFKQGFSQKRFDRWFYDVKESPRYKLMEQSGLYVADPHDPRMTAREESFMSNLGEKVPIVGETLKFKVGDKNVKIPGLGLVRGSERAYVSYLNKMRVDLFNRMVDDFEAQGSSFEKDPKLFKDLANFVNNATGRGNLGFAESAGPVLSSTFFSPRLIASRLSLLRDVATFGNFGRMHPEVRKVMYKDMLAFVGTGLSVLALVKGSSWALNCKDENGEPCVTVEADPRSSDFGKIKSGNMRWDIWGGFQQYIRVLTQLGSGETKSSTSGQVQELDGKGQFGKTRLDQGMSFLRGKLAPAPSMLVDVLGGRTATGEKVTLKDEAVGHLLPLIASDLRDAMQDKGVKAIFTMGIPSTFGVGVSTYLPRGYEGKDVKQDPVYSFLYKKSMAIAPPVIDNVPEETRPAFISKREEIFKREWDKVIKYGGLIDENGHATTDTKRAVKRIDTDKLDREDLSDLMRSISTKSTRAAEKELNIKVGRKPKVRA